MSGSPSRRDALKALLLQRRLPFVLISLWCAALLGFGYYLQFAQGLTPCPLCVFQRLAFFGVLVLALPGALFGPRKPGAQILNFLLALTAGVGAAIAGRQVWLQHLPADRIPECGPGLDFLLETSPLTETIKTVLRGSGDCAKVDWTFLGLSIAEWSLINFLALMALALVCLFLRRQ